MILPLTNPVQPYAWGSRTIIAELLGEPSPSEHPQAELWLGAHPRGPSMAGADSLAAVISRDPEAALGPAVLAEFGARLPFLLKVLAADRPLSIQAHPSAERARAGFAAEEELGVPLDAAHRNYKDDWPKPELICALTDFDALCGFRDPAESRRLFDDLVRAGAATLAPYAEMLGAPADLAALVGSLLTLPCGDAAALVADVARACGEVADAGSAPRPELGWAVRLGADYPADPGVVVALLLNHVRLAAGQALYLSAGNMHAYLRGAGVELMASSDNVLRGGLTGKHVDVSELLRVLDASPWQSGVLVAERHGSEQVYATSARHFRLSRLELAGERAELTGGVPQILLCLAGSVDVRTEHEHVTLLAGRSAFVGADTPGFVVEGRGRVFRATTGGACRA